MAVITNRFARSMPQDSSDTYGTGVEVASVRLESSQGGQPERAKAERRPHWVLVVARGSLVTKRRRGGTENTH
jgi:hypothetical protein